MVIIYLAIGLGVMILAALVILIILVLRNSAQKAVVPDPGKNNPYRDLKPVSQGFSSPNHDNMTINLNILNRQNDHSSPGADGESSVSAAEIPRMSEEAKTVGTDVSKGPDCGSPVEKGPRRTCHAIIQYEDNNRMAMYEMYESTVLIGRDPALCDIALQGNFNGKVSRCHALLRYMDNMLYISDLNSRNKTYVNNREVEGKVQITGDCTIVLANAPLQIKLLR